MDISFQQWGNSDSLEQILFIHGWGMNSGVWQDIVEHLTRENTQISSQQLIRSVDLPGYGHSVNYSIDELGGQYSSHTLAKSLEPLLAGKQTTVIAWSMGGLAAIELLANKGLNISQLILVSSTPRFVQAQDWPDAVEAKVFEAFSKSLMNDNHATLKHFLAIQALGSRTAREDIKTLQKQLFLRGEPDSDALKSGLNILLTEDKRAQLQGITDTPITLISGMKDTLVAHQGQKQLAEQKNIALISIPRAGHAPFISHPEEFKQIIQNII
ncbi:MAG: alpha/beta fold hydrolase [gamma proteobacterium symbiont of Bathyaustriella thionipta]|nr:alpha/beta fold hydrolase [gamma proteobacterium symbiont of Bathyaustriella thionipta]MCU7949132.1 alpha/beta fold hydrolase [gamma proteobacterium symbiont of Bathyaustriella thionipta]MCU7952249.1 alpha/beta fold hydrolase [gamma proteobacterium symbiont of Bathyaustriella thionipta]MCU7955799.1 alpha/beta fold hydrolase [gamma proteobacterium symbiont of Bathyaustriella thionipta]MCU7968033.1 alpha/beta fold hydrolase [gamma proteobacterium symbiont of Bathyaustriella thionipta]